MQFGVLGPLEVSADGQAVLPGGLKARALLAVLLLHANEPVSPDRLALALWGEDAAAGSIKTVQVHVSRLRKALGDGNILETTPAGYRLRVLPGELDAERFEQLVDEARQELTASKPERAAALLHEALALWRGPALCDLEREPFAAAEIRRLEESRLDATELAIDAELAAGRHRVVIGEIEALVADHPLRERPHAQRMLALYRCSRQAEALDAYREARDLLVERIGVEPGTELRRLHEAILRQDPSLELQARALPRELDLANAPPMFGREGDLAILRERWRQASEGAGGIVLVTGPRGIGKTRLAAALARDVHRAGAAVLYASGEKSGAALAAERSAREMTGPTLLVVDDAAVGDLPDDLSGSPTLIVATTESSGPPAAFDGRAQVALEPLDATAVCRIALLYAPGRAAADVPIDELLEASEGLPSRVHPLAEQWARGGVVAVAKRAAAGRSELRAIEAELAGSVVDLQAARERTAPQAGDEPLLVCPFKGLASFEIADAKYFFGRERLVAELVARLVGAPLVGVVGASGSGKSSLVRAGLLPALAGGVLPGSDEWAQMLVRPGDHPMRELAAASEGIGRERRVVLVVDQFEELFTACTDEHERSAFIDALARERTDRQAGPVVLAIRADFYGRCAEYPALSDLLGANQVLVGPMRRDELRRAIELPAQRVGLRVDPELVEALVGDVADEPGSLPLLSTSLLQLWQRGDGRRLRHADYEGLGGVHGAVARLAEDAFGRLDPSQQTVARRVLLRLAGEGAGGVPVRRRVAVADLEGQEGEDLGPVLQTLTDRRLLTVSDTTVEVAHEALLREWPRLRGWLEEDAQGRRVQRHLADTAREWDDRGRDPADLYRGARLAVAKEWRLAHEAELNPTERAFLDAGTAAGDRAQRRLRLVLAGVAALLALALVAAVVAVHQRSTARAQARAAEAQRLGVQALTDQVLDRSLLLARQGVALDDSRATRSDLFAALARSPAAVKVMRGVGSPLNALALSPDGRALAVSDSRGKVLFFDPRTGRRVGSPFDILSPLNPGISLAFDAGGDRLAFSAPFTDHIGLIDARTHAYVGRLSLPATVVGGGVILFSPDGRLVVAGGIVAGRGAPQSTIAVWDAHTGRAVGRQAPRTGPASELVGFIAGGRRLVTTSPTGRMTVIREMPSLRPLRTFRAGGSPAAVSPDGRLVAFGGVDGIVRLLDLRTAKLRVTNGAEDGAVTDLRFGSDSHTLIAGSGDGSVAVWNVQTGTRTETFQGHAGAVSQVATSPDGRTAYAAGEDGTIVVWDLAGGRRLARPFEAPRWSAPGRLPQGGLANMAATGDGERFAVLGAGYVDVFTSRTLKRTARILVSAAGPPSGVAIAPDGTIAVTTSDGRLGLGHLTSQTALGPLHKDHDGESWSPSFSGDGRWLATLGPANDVNLWDVHRRRLVNTNYGPQSGTVAAVALSPDGTKLAEAVNNYDGTGELDIHSVPGLALLSRRLAPPVESAQFSRDGRLLFWGDVAGRAWLYDTRSWKPDGSPFAGHAGPVVSINLSPDGRTLATSSSDGTTRLWDLDSRQPIGTPLPGSFGHAVVSAFVDRGTHLVTVYDDGHGWSWDIRPRSWERRACEVAGRMLTRAEWQDALPEHRYAPTCAQK